MNLKKIIKEEIDDWDWVRELQPSFVLEPNTVYYFRPMLKKEEFQGLKKRVNNPELGGILDFLSRQPSTDGVQYFVYDFKEKSDKLRYWENIIGEDPMEGSEASMDDAKYYYPDYNFVDFRKTYPQLFY